MNNDTLLSICIPTYNRASCLKQCLESITLQFSDPEVKRQVEVFISDNASSDTTEQVVNGFQQKFSNISYNKNPQNLGFDRSALLLVEKAQGEFVWFMGDDDALFPDAIKYLLEQIKQQKFKYCVVNFWGYDKNLEQLALKYPNPAIRENQLFEKLEDYIKKTKPDENLVGFFCGLSVQIFNRELWQNFPDKNKFIGTHAMHLYVLLSAMKEQPFALFAKPLVKARSDNIRWETFSGLGTAKSRAQATQKILLWILDFYNIPHSKALMKCKLYVNMAKNFTMGFIRNKIFKSQTTRDFIKKIFGKL
jgi:abequosyltransferase